MSSCAWLHPPSASPFCTEYFRAHRTRSWFDERARARLQQCALPAAAGSPAQNTLASKPVCRRACTRRITASRTTARQTGMSGRTCAGADGSLVVVSRRSVCVDVTQTFFQNDLTLHL